MNGIFQQSMWSRLSGVAGVLAFILMTAASVLAENAQQIEDRVDAAIQRFKEEVGGSERFLQAAKGILVFPTVYRAGFGIGGEYGEGALRVDGRTVDYYNTLAASLGFEMGGQAKTIILVFTQKQALKRFRSNNGWKAGVDGPVVSVKDTSDDRTASHPILGFVLDQKGRMHDLNLDGSRFTKLDKS